MELTVSQTKQPLITFTVPCYNSAEYLDACVESLIPAGEDIEIILVNDGSTKDNTSEKIHAWENRLPGIVKAIDQPNKGHGGAVNTGLANATGMYFKVVDSDDWLDADALPRLMACLRLQAHRPEPTDMVVANYIYDKVHEGTKTVIDYKSVFPVDCEFTWEEVGRFRQGQFILMHAVVYRTELLRECGIQLPEHTFYVDNIFVYVPMASVQTIHYLNIDLYHYFIGREDQSVNESVMMGRIDQQLRITRVMIDSIKLPNASLHPRLQAYLVKYLAMMMCICSIFLRMIGDAESEQKRKDIWRYLLVRNRVLYRLVRRELVCIGVNLPGKVGRKIGIGGYHLAQKVFKFN